MIEPIGEKDDLNLQQSKNCHEDERHSPWYLIGKHKGGNLQPTCYASKTHSPERSGKPDAVLFLFLTLNKRGEKKTQQTFFIYITNYSDLFV